MPPSRLLLLLLVAAGAASTQALVPPHFPRVFSASLEVTTKHLDKANVYPPAWRTIEVDYDFIQKRARAYVQTSYEKRQKTNGTTTLRRYDLGKEWEIAQFGKEMVCKWSRILNAKMPRPHLFDPDLQLDHEQVTRKVDGKDEKCLHWWQAGVDGSVTHFYETVATRTPVLLENDDMTYEFLRFERGEQSQTASVEATYAVPREYQDEGSCERVAQDVGFPYIHLLHTFVRF